MLYVAIYRYIYIYLNTDITYTAHTRLACDKNNGVLLLLITIFRLNKKKNLNTTKLKYGSNLFIETIMIWILKIKYKYLYF